MSFQAHAAHHFENAPCVGPNMDDWHIPETISPDTIEEFAGVDEIPLEVVEHLEERRKQARLACYDDCPMKARLLCLDEGLRPENIEHGIWGGFHASQRRAVRRAALERGKAQLDHRAIAAAILDAERRETRTS